MDTGKNTNNIIKITKGETNWFYVILVFLAGVGSVSLIYILLLFAMIDVEEISQSPLIFSKQAPVILSLQTEKSEYNLNELFEVNILVDSGKRKTAGVDIVLTYNPQILELQSKNQTANSPAIKEKTGAKKQPTQNPQDFLDTEFSSFDIFPYIKIDAVNGKIYFSALSKPLKEVSGKGIVGSLTFKTKATDSTQINFDFQKGLTIDSNVAFLGKDILDKVYGIDVKIK